MVLKIGQAQGSVLFPLTFNFYMQGLPRVTGKRLANADYIAIF